MTANIGRWQGAVKLALTLLHHIQGEFRIPQDLAIRHNGPFEFYGVKERHYILQIATWYLLDWPNRFLEISKNLRIRYSELMREFEAAPFWFLDEARRLEFKPIGPSEGELAAMRALWESAHDPIKQKQLKRRLCQRIGNKSINFLYK